MRRLAAMCVLAVAAGCGLADEDPQPRNEQQLAQTIEDIAEARPEPKTGAPGPNLIKVSREDVEAALPQGPGCDFSDRGELLFAAGQGGQALARVNGLPVRFASEGPVGPSGGFFAAERYRVSIAPLSREGIEIGQNATWPARLVLTDRRRTTDNELRLEGTWRCGD
jgi:hypothetical protein